MDSLIEFGSKIFKNKRANVPEHIEAKPETSFLRDATPDQATSFFGIIGQGVQAELDKKGLPLKYYSFRGDDDHFAVVYAGKVLQFNMKEKWEDSNKADIVLGFINERDLPPPGSSSLLDGSLGVVDEDLGKQTGEFLRFAADLIKKADDSCHILLSPTSKRRERLYRKFAAKINKPNVKVGDSNFDDIKKPKTEY